MIIQITSRTNDKIKHLISLKNKKTREEEGLFVAEGKKALEMALASDLVEEVYSLKKISLPANIKLYLINESVLEKIASSKSPEGIVFIARIPKYELKKKDKLIYLDNLQDPGNVGTLIRSALALGYDAVLLSETTCDPYNEKAIAASKGSIFSLPVIKDNLANYKKTHDIIVSTLDDKSVSLDDIEVQDKFVLVLGNEAHGVSQSSLDLASKRVKIPIKGINSLNVSAAGAILMYELNK